MEGHLSKDKECKAWGKINCKCNGKDHFERVRKSKSGKASKPARNIKPGRVRQVENPNENRYAFTWKSKVDIEVDAKLTVGIGGVPVTMVIDSGATCNVIDCTHWEYLKESNVKCHSSKCSQALYPYGST